MLKIKDNVDLKELKKFGFEYYINKFYNDKIEKGYRLYSESNIIEIVEERIGYPWSSYNKEREIFVYESYCEIDFSNVFLDVLFDLIQAGLVEKVVHNG